MPKSKHLSAYPEQYFDVYELVEQSQEFTFPALGHREALALRLDLYGFKGALRHEQHPAHRKWDKYKILINDTEEGSYLSIRDCALDFEALFKDIPIKQLPTTSPSLNSSEPCEDDGLEDEMDDTLKNMGYGLGDEDES